MIGVNKYQVAGDAKIDILKVDNTAVRNRQIEKLKRLRASATRARRKPCWRSSRKWHDQAKAICSLRCRCARAPCDGGENFAGAGKGFSAATTPVTRAVKGIYAATPRDQHKIEHVKHANAAFRRRMGGRRRSSSPRSARTDTTAAEGDRLRLHRHGLRCHHRPALRDPEEVAKMAVDEKVHAVGSRR